MRIVYIDEAGISNKAHEPFTVVAGVVVHADNDLQRLEAALEALVKRHIPAHQQAGFVFHAKDLFNGGGKVFRRDQWPIEKRLEIAADLANLIVEFDLPVSIGRCERATQHPLFTAFGGGELKTAIMCSFGEMMYGADCWVRKHAADELCMLVIEDSNNVKPLITGMWELSRKMDPAKFMIKKVKVDPLFQPKRPNSVLQLADFCAYVMKKVLMKNEHYYDLASTIEKQVLAVWDAWPKPKETGA